MAVVLNWGDAHHQRGYNGYTNMNVLGQHAQAAGNLGEVTAGNKRWRLIANSELESKLTTGD